MSNTQPFFYINIRKKKRFLECRKQGSNLRPTRYECVALPTELFRLMHFYYTSVRKESKYFIKNSRENIQGKESMEMKKSFLKNESFRLQTKSEYDKLISLLSERSLIKQFQKNFEKVT